jgi:hypothetical protein
MHPGQSFHTAKLYFDSRHTSSSVTWKATERALLKTASGIQRVSMLAQLFSVSQEQMVNTVSTS